MGCEHWTRAVCHALLAGTTKRHTLRAPLDTAGMVHQSISGIQLEGQSGHIHTLQHHSSEAQDPSYASMVSSVTCLSPTNVTPPFHLPGRPQAICILSCQDGSYRSAGLCVTSILQSGHAHLWQVDSTMGLLPEGCSTGFTLAIQSTSL